MLWPLPFQYLVYSGMSHAVAAGRATDGEVEKFQMRLYLWAMHVQGASHPTTRKVANCVQEAYLLMHFISDSCSYWPLVPGTRNWRYRFLRQVAKFLWWPECYKEGDPRGFPADINNFLRHTLWPQALDCNEGPCKGGCSRALVGETGKRKGSNWKAIVGSSPS
jgi:hypothetical protein